MLPAKTIQTLNAVRMISVQNPDGAFLIDWTVNLVERMNYINHRLLQELLELRRYKQEQEGRKSS